MLNRASHERGGAHSVGGGVEAKNSGTRIYGSRIRVRTGGSRWQSALPTGSADSQSAGKPADSQTFFGRVRPMP